MKNKDIAILILIVILLIFGYKFNERGSVIRCYEEQANSYLYPESFFVQTDFKEFCLKKGIIIKEIGIDYENIPSELKYNQ